MQIKEIKEKTIWERFLSECREKTFLQSWNWGIFQEKMGNKIWRFGVYDREQLITVCLVVKISAKRGTFLFVPHLPSVALAKEDGLSNKKEILRALLEKLKKLSKEEKASFVRMSPIWERNQENISVFKELGFKKSPTHMHAEVTWVLDITLPEEILLENMRKTTRYLTKKAPKDGVEIIKSEKIEDLEAFNRLYSKTVDRHHFVPFSFEYLKNEFLSFRPDDQILIFLARYKKEVISSAIIIFWSDIAFYHHGASSLKYPKVPASYYLQWEAIREAKIRGCQKYNFWGIADVDQKSEKNNFVSEERKNRKHPWYGLSLFKMGFGGYKKEYVRAQDLPLSLSYWLTFLFEKIRKSKRGL